MKRTLPLAVPVVPPAPAGPSEPPPLPELLTPPLPVEVDPPAAPAVPAAPATRSKRIITVAAINKANAALWEYEALRDKVGPSDDERALLLSYEAVAKRMRELSGQKGTKISAQVRGDNTERKRLVHELRASGETPQKIHGDPNFQARYPVSLATVYRDLDLEAP